MSNSTTKAKLQLIISMVIFGTIGIFKKNIHLPSSFIAMTRGFVGMIFLLRTLSLQIHLFHQSLDFLVVDPVSSAEQLLMNSPYAVSSFVFLINGSDFNHKRLILQSVDV